MVNGALKKNDHKIIMELDKNSFVNRGLCHRNTLRSMNEITH